MVTKEDPQILCRRIFSLDFPPDGDKLKSRFRSMSLSEEYRHPDKGGSNEKFLELLELYKYLSTFSRSYSFRNTPPLIGGRPITEYGKGLGNTVNGISCDFCQTKGYYSVTRRVPDRSSPGTTCGSCRGIPLMSFFLLCSKCGGEGRLYPRIESTLYYKCSKCEGTGEIRMFNPVFQRGAFGL